MKSVFLSGVACLFSIGAVMAQTTLSGDHVITGDLDVGATGALGNLKISGETGNAAAPGIRVTGDGGVVFEGTYGTGQLPAISAGAGMMWYPKKAAFRAGYHSSTPLVDGDIGPISFAFGRNNIASGEMSVALGYESIAAHNFSLAAGVWTTAMGESSLAVGDSAYALGVWSVAVGLAAYAAQDEAFALGSMTVASGRSSFSIGANVINSTAYSTVIGRYNINRSESSDEWRGSDTLFVVANGNGIFSDPKEQSDAFVIFKNGNVQIPKRQGDILMGEFGNPE